MPAPGSTGRHAGVGAGGTAIALPRGRSNAARHAASARLRYRLPPEPLPDHARFPAVYNPPQFLSPECRPCRSLTPPKI